MNYTVKTPAGRFSVRVLAPSEGEWTAEWTYKRNDGTLGSRHSCGSYVDGVNGIVPGVALGHRTLPQALAKRLPGVIRRVVETHEERTSPDAPQWNASLSKILAAADQLLDLIQRTRLGCPPSEGLFDQFVEAADEITGAVDAARENHSTALRRMG